MSRSPHPRAVSLATSESFLLAEGPLWDPIAGCVRWVDIPRGHVLSGELTPSGTIRLLDRVGFDAPVSALAVSGRGDWIMALRDRVVFRDPDGRLSSGPEVFPCPGRRLNDGKPDPAGLFVVGSLMESGDSDSEVLVTVGRSDVCLLDDDLSLSNGLAWSPDGTLMYSVDTKRGRIYQRRWAPGVGAIGPRETFLDLAADRSNMSGYPDGICTDAEGQVWVAMWGAGQIRRYNTRGVLTDTRDVPAPHVSSVAFVGEALDILVITTSVQGLDDDSLRRYPRSGHLFTTRVETGGLGPPLWSGPQL